MGYLMRLQRWENGPYFADFSLHIPDMRVEIVKICPRSPTVSLSNTWYVLTCQIAKELSCYVMVQCVGSRTDGIPTVDQSDMRGLVTAWQTIRREAASL